MKRYIHSTTSKATLPGSIVYDRLIDKCYWSKNAAWGLIDEDKEYTLRDLKELLADACSSSGEFDSTLEAVKWGKKCAAAIFEDKPVY